MITSLKELCELKEICERIRKELAAPRIPLGIMIEVPAAAILAGILAKEADFFSIGTNDLTQYTLAMDRQNPVLAQEIDGLHPAVLNLIKVIVAGARMYKRHVGVCGGIAGDKKGALLLAGLGVDDLSMTPRDIPEIKEVIRGCDYIKLAAIANQALLLETPSEVRSLLESA
jgi:phosphocarrier protein FPr